MERLNILVVEDDDIAFYGYKDAAEDLSDDALSIQLKRSTSAKVAIQKLNNEVFQGAIIDLELLDEPDSEHPSGNEVISEINHNFRIPIIVASGNINNLDPKFEIDDNQFIKRFNRDEKTNIEIFEEIIKIYKTGILNIIGGMGLIEKKLNEVFWDHLSKDIDAWFTTDNNAERSLLRYTLNHLSAYLDQNDDPINSYREAEFYLKPPIKKVIASGDILLNPVSKERFILLSPACDVEVRSDGKINAKSLVLAKICESDPEALLASQYIKKNKADNVRSFIVSVVHGTKLSCAYLPPYKEIKEGIIEFHNLVTISYDNYADYDRLATVSVNFFKDIQSRSSSYYARQGTPDLNKANIVGNYMSRHFPS